MHCDSTVTRLVLQTSDVSELARLANAALEGHCAMTDSDSTVHRVGTVRAIVCNYTANINGGVFNDLFVWLVDQCHN